MIKQIPKDGAIRETTISCGNCPHEECKAVKFCLGCGEWLCPSCWGEHNLDWDCHCKTGLGIVTARKSKVERMKHAGL